MYVHVLYINGSLVLPTWKYEAKTANIAAVLGHVTEQIHTNPISSKEKPTSKCSISLDLFCFCHLSISNFQAKQLLPSHPTLLPCQRYGRCAQGSRTRPKDIKNHGVENSLAQNEEIKSENSELQITATSSITKRSIACRIYIYIMQLISFLVFRAFSRDRFNVSQGAWWVFVARLRVAAKA